MAYPNNSISIRIPKDLRRFLEEMADKEGHRSIGSMIAAHYRRQKHSQWPDGAGDSEGAL